MGSNGWRRSSAANRTSGPYHPDGGRRSSPTADTVLHTPGVSPGRGERFQRYLEGLQSLAPWRRIVDTLTGMAGGSKSDSRSDEQEPDTRVTRRRWQWAFWAGVVLAPIAALLLLIGQGVGPLRAAAILAVLAVVLIGLSVTFRDDPASVREELTEEFRREIESMRVDVETLRRGVQLTVNRELDRVRGELEATRSVMHAEATRLPPTPTTYQTQVGGFASLPQQVISAEQAASNAAEPVRPAGTTYSSQQAAPAEAYVQRTYSYQAAAASWASDDFDTGDFFPDVQTVEPIHEERSAAPIHPAGSYAGYAAAAPPQLPATQSPDPWQPNHPASADALNPISGDVLAPFTGPSDYATGSVGDLYPALSNRYSRPANEAATSYPTSAAPAAPTSAAPTSATPVSAFPTSAAPTSGTGRVSASVSSSSGIFSVLPPSDVNSWASVQQPPPAPAPGWGEAEFELPSLDHLPELPAENDSSAAGRHSRH